MLEIYVCMYVGGGVTESTLKKNTGWEDKGIREHFL